MFLLRCLPFELSIAKRIQPPLPTVNNEVNFKATPAPAACVEQLHKTICYNVHTKIKHPCTPLPKPNMRCGQIDLTNNEIRKTASAQLARGSTEQTTFWCKQNNCARSPALRAVEFALQLGPLAKAVTLLFTEVLVLAFRGKIVPLPISCKPDIHVQRIRISPIRTRETHRKIELIPQAPFPSRPVSSCCWQARPGYGRKKTQKASQSCRILDRLVFSNEKHERIPQFLTLR